MTLVFICRLPYHLWKPGKAGFPNHCGQCTISWAHQAYRNWLSLYFPVLGPLYCPPFFSLIETRGKPDVPSIPQAISIYKLSNLIYNFKRPIVLLAQFVLPFSLHCDLSMRLELTIDPFTHQKFSFWSPLICIVLHPLSHPFSWTSLTSNGTSFPNLDMIRWVSLTILPISWCFRKPLLFLCSQNLLARPISKKWGSAWR